MSAILSEEKVLEICFNFFLFESQNIRKQMPTETVSTADHHPGLNLAIRSSL